MSRLFLFLAALPCLLAAPAVAEPLYLKCPADAKSYAGWRLVLDPEAGTVDLYRDPKRKEIYQISAAWRDGKRRLDAEFYDGDAFFTLTADLAARTLAVDTNPIGSRPETSETFPCAAVPPFTPAEFDRAADFAHLPPDERAAALARATLHLKCPADAKSYHGWRLILDPEAGTVELYEKPSRTPMRQFFVYWYDEGRKAAAGFADGNDTFVLTADLEALTLEVELSRIGSRRSSSSTFACALVGPFTLKEFDRAEDFAHLPPEERAQALANDAAMKEAMAEYDRQIALHGWPVPWDAIALFGGLGAGALLLLGAMIRGDLQRRRDRRDGGA